MYVFLLFQGLRVFTLSTRLFLPCQTLTIRVSTGLLRGVHTPLLERGSTAGIRHLSFQTLLKIGNVYGITSKTRKTSTHRRKPSKQNGQAITVIIIGPETGFCICPTEWYGSS